MVQIREATADDVPAMYTLLRDSAIAQNGLEEFCATAETLREDCFGVKPLYRAWIAVSGGLPAGIALCYFSASTWTCRRSLYLEDLYVAPAFRRHGVAHALMSSAAQFASANGCGRVHWLVRRDNAPALRLYASIGAGAGEEWMPMHLLAANFKLEGR